MPGPAPEDLERSVARLLPDLRAYVRLKCGPRLREQESCSDLVQSALREVLVELDRQGAAGLDGCSRAGADRGRASRDGAGRDETDRDGFAPDGARAAATPDRDPSLRARVFRAAEHKIVDRARHWARDKRDWARREGLAEPDGALLASYASLSTPSQKMIGQEAVERLEAAFDRLSDRDRQAILLVRCAGLSYEALGEELGMSPHSARTMVSRALARLASVWSPA